MLVLSRLIGEDQLTTLMDGALVLSKKMSTGSFAPVNQTAKQDKRELGLGHERTLITKVYQEATGIIIHDSSLDARVLSERCTPC